MVDDFKITRCIKEAEVGYRKNEKLRVYAKDRERERLENYCVWVCAESSLFSRTDCCVRRHDNLQLLEIKAAVWAYYCQLKTNLAHVFFALAALTLYLCLVERLSVADRDHTRCLL